MYLLAAVFVLSSFCQGNLVNDQAWDEYKQEFGKTYITEQEDEVRYNIWKHHSQQVLLHNTKYSQSSSYQQGINQFSDMTDDEFQTTMCNCLNVPAQNTTTQGDGFRQRMRTSDVTTTLPDTVDWVSKGYVTSIKSQGHCGSCYAFSATGALEGQWFHKTGRLPVLSEQQIVDCSRKWGNKGCGGGWYESAWEYIRDVKGSDFERAYPYEAKEGACRFDDQQVGATVKSLVDLPYADEKALKQAVATVGPVSIAIHVKSSLRHYKEGVYYERRCLKEFWQLNHAVLAVGYGTENGHDYWLVKNSWGAKFGLSGYMKMSRNRNNNCGIATKASYPVV